MTYPDKGLHATWKPTEGLLISPILCRLRKMCGFLMSLRSAACTIGAWESAGWTVLYSNHGLIS